MRVPKTRVSERIGDLWQGGAAPPGAGIGRYSRSGSGETSDGLTCWMVAEFSHRQADRVTSNACQLRRVTLVALGKARLEVADDRAELPRREEPWPERT
jgi:hypothetical protein